MRWLGYPLLLHRGVLMSPLSPVLRYLKLGASGVEPALPEPDQAPGLSHQPLSWRGIHIGLLTGTRDSVGAVQCRCNGRAE